MLQKLASQPSSNQSHLDWWQREDLCYHNGELVFAGHPVKLLAERYGTPSFVYSLDRAKNNLTRLHEALNESGFGGRYRILYAMKANRFAPLLTGLKLSGLCGIDACSPEEVEHAIACGFSPSEISFTAGSLTQKEYEILAKYEDLGMNCDSIHAIRSWGNLRPGTKMGIRINPAVGVSREGNERLQYAGRAISKFGIYQEQFDEALDLANKFNLKVTDIHFHTGCGYLTSQLEQWSNVMERCLWFLDKCEHLNRVNVGGGLGVPHQAEDGILDLVAWGRVLAKYFGNRDIKLDIEPGEYIMKDAGLLLLQKTFLERKSDTLFLGVDAGFNIAPEPAWYDLRFLPLPLIAPQGSINPVTVVGNINEALDVWYKDALLPDMTEQPFLALLNGGAYSSSMASNHCMRGKLKEILLI